MIASICYIDSANMILSCDGKSFEVIGASPVAESIRKTSKKSDSLFSSIMKGEKEKFDPVQYWLTSSQNFADSEPPVKYSKEVLETMKAKLKSDSKND